MSDVVKAALASVIEGGVLSRAEARAAMGAVMDGEATQAQLAFNKAMQDATSITDENNAKLLYRSKLLDISQQSLDDINKTISSDPDYERIVKQEESGGTKTLTTP